MSIKVNKLIRSPAFSVLRKLIEIFALLGFVALSLSCGGSGNGDDNGSNGDAQYSVGGSVAGLAGSGLVLQNNNADDLPIFNDGPFEFATRLDDGADYAVTVKDHPVSPFQACQVADGTGAINGSDVTGVDVSCMATATAGDCESGSILYSHDATSDFMGFSQTITVNGSVPFTCDDSNNISGSGSLNIAVTGSVVSICDQCSWSGSATMNVTLSGALVATIVTIQFDEVWYVGSPVVSGTCTDFCNNETSPYSYPLQQVLISHTLQFPDIDGHTIQAPATGAATAGTYSWTLSIQ
ncbi:MAG: hypothetical protein HKN08_01330 [Gammaproteobacteria bacterium]|nr:hypothetical protein [Gammaproteobacteria bacterium]